MGQQGRVAGKSPCHPAWRPEFRSQNQHGGSENPLQQAVLRPPPEGVRAQGSVMNRVFKTESVPVDLTVSDVRA